MFEPSRDQVREMFFETWRKYRAGLPLAGIESLALDTVLLHPEYHDVLSMPARYRDKEYTDESNPFLHMSLHIALLEQLSIDQPPASSGFSIFFLRNTRSMTHCTRPSRAWPRPSGARSGTASRPTRPPISPASGRGRREPPCPEGPSGLGPFGRADTLPAHHLP